MCREKEGKLIIKICQNLATILTISRPGLQPISCICFHTHFAMSSAMYIANVLLSCALENLFCKVCCAHLASSNFVIDSH